MPSVIPMTLRRARDFDASGMSPGEAVVVADDGLTFTTAPIAAADDPRLSDERVPPDDSVDYAKIADELKPAQGAGAAQEALRALGSTAATAAAGNDSRLATYQTVEDELVALAARAKLSFQGAAVTASDDAANNRTVVTISASAGYDRVQDEGTNLAQRSKINFKGAAVSAADNSGTGATDVTVTETPRRWGHSFAVVAPTARVYPGFHVIVSIGHTKKLQGAYFISDAAPATPMTFYVRRNGLTMTGWGTAGAPLSASTTPTSVDPADIAVAEGDVIDIVIVSVGTGTWLQLTPVIEET